MMSVEEQAQRRAALRALLLKPLLVSDADAEMLMLVRRHLAELREWLNRETGWRLVADSETARLFTTAPVLLSWGVLGRVAGDEDACLSADGDVLYDVRGPVLAVLLSGTRGPSTVTATGFEERLAELVAEPVPETDDLRNLTFRRRITRRLLEDPVLYYDELDEDERASCAPSCGRRPPSTPGTGARA